ncbi:12321_t:CDS:2 [Acaulospora morrowiae]|uniref:12321_t:CDS:1 n=1 Tax=Acaulospora morrowiae TaxID=94023 RepID=A0A9N8ZBX2_9GLOM|nr:12321_t:CDS:2 [Acaulospora morrowiae]
MDIEFDICFLLQRQNYSRAEFIRVIKKLREDIYFYKKTVAHSNDIESSETKKHEFKKQIAPLSVTQNGVWLLSEPS